MNNWKKTVLSEVAEVRLSNVDKKTEEGEIDVRLCNYMDVYKNAFINSFKAESFMLATCNQNELNNFKLKEGQVAITKDSEKRDDIGISTYIAESFDDVVLGYHTALITPKEKLLNGKYLNYLFNTKYAKVYFENNAGGSGQRCTLPIDIIKSIPLNLPPIELQVQIASIFYNIDAKIELNTRINAELEAMAKTIYDYWFVQFDFPISAEQAKAMGKPELEGKPYKSSGGNMVWNAALKREVPEGWEIKKIKEISQTGSGGTPLSRKKEYYESGNIPWINSGEVNSSFIIESSKFITQEGLQNSSAKIFPKGTILMAMYGATAGQVSLMEIEACTNQAICAIIPYNSKMIPFLKFALHDIYKHLVNLSSGSARDNLSQDKIRDLEFAIPEKSLIENFHEIANFNFSKIIICLRENRELSTLRDWLLPMLMNGQVKVEN